MTRLFVYGSLRRGGRHHEQLLGAEPLGPTRTRPGHRLVLQGSYPALAPGTEVVHGELYRVSSELLARLDRFEGCPELYRRMQIELCDGTTAEAYGLEAERARGLPEIPGGRWER